MSTVFMSCVGTNALLAKVSGKTITKVSHCTASTLFAMSPTIAANHEKASVKTNRISAINNHC